MWAVPGPVASSSSSTRSGGVGGGGPLPGGGGGSLVSLTLWMLVLSSSRAGFRPAIGTPSLPDREDAVEVRVRHVRRGRCRRPAGRRRVARDVGMAPTERIGLHAARVVRERE